MASPKKVCCSYQRPGWHTNEAKGSLLLYANPFASVASLVTKEYLTADNSYLTSRCKNSGGIFISCTVLFFASRSTGYYVLSVLHSRRGKWLWNSTRFFGVCCCWLFGLDRAQNTIVVYSVLRNWPIETCWLRNSCIVHERKTKDCGRSWTLASLFAPLMFAGLHNQFPLLTMSTAIIP